MSDEGMYRCEATNKHGQAKTQATAHVESEDYGRFSVRDPE